MIINDGYCIWFDGLNQVKLVKMLHICVRSTFRNQKVREEFLLDSNEKR